MTDFSLISLICKKISRNMMRDVQISVNNSAISAITFLREQQETGNFQLD